MDSAQTKIDSIKTDAFIINSSSIDTNNIDSIVQVRCNVIQQEGKFNISKIWSEIDIPIIVSIIIFILGFVIAEIIRRWNKSCELKQQKKFILEWLEKSISTLITYIESLQEFSDEISENKGINIVKWKTSLIHVSRINSIPLEKYSEIFIFGIHSKDHTQDRKELMNMLYQIEYLEKAPTVIKEIYDKYCTDMSNIRDEWNIYYSEILNLSCNYIKEHKSEELECGILKSVLELYTPLMNTKENQIFAGTDIWMSRFIIPASEILGQEEYMNFQIISQVYTAVQNLRITIIKCDNIRNYSKVFTENIVVLNKAKQVLDKSIHHFKSKKISHFYR